MLVGLAVDGLMLNVLAPRTEFLAVLPFLSPEAWYRALACRKDFFELSVGEVRRIVDDAGWLRRSRVLSLGEAARQGLLHVVFARLRALEEDPNTWASTDLRYTPLLRATSGGHRAIVQLLLSAKAKPTPRDPLGFSALHLAVNHGPLLVSDLLSARCDVSAANVRGLTPLHSAAGLGRADVCKVLLDAGARASQPSHSGMTPAALARRCAARRKGGSGVGGLGLTAADADHLAIMLETAAQEEVEGWLNIGDVVKEESSDNLEDLLTSPSRILH